MLPRTSRRAGPEADQHVVPRDPDTMNPSQRSPSEEFLREVARVKAKCGRVRLTRDDMLLLACDELRKTYTHAERGYA